MYGKLIIIGAVFLAVIFQSSFLINFFQQGLAPDILLILTIFLAAKFDFHHLWKIILLFGFLKDILLFFPAGTHVAALALVAFITNMLIKKFIVIHSSWKFFIFIVLVVCGTVLYHVTLDAIWKLFSSFHAQSVEPLSFSYFKIKQTILFNIILFVLLYIPLQKLDVILSRYSQLFIFQRDGK